MEPEKQSAIQIIKAASLKEKLMLIYACTFQFIVGIPFAATPFWQMNPKFICSDGPNSFQCSAAVACSDKYRNTFTVDPKGITKSIIIEKELYCEKQSIWANSQTLNMAVVLLITVLFLFKKVQPEQRYKFILISQSLFVMAALLTITVSNLNVILILLAVLYLANQVFYLQMYPFLNSYMNPQLQTVGVTIYNAFYALGFAVYPIVDSFFLDWKKMMLFFIATPVILNVIYIIFVFNNYLQPSTDKAKSMTPLLEAPKSNELEQKINSPSKQDQQRTSKFGLKFKESQLGLRRQNSFLALEIPSTKKEELLKNYDEIDQQKQPAKIFEEPAADKSLSPINIIQDKYLLQVTAIFIILVLSTGAAFLGSQFCINMLPVDIYSISIVLGICEALASLYSAQITAKFPIKTIIKYTSLLIAVTLIPFYFQDLNSNSSSAISSYIFFCLYVVAKTAMFVNWAFAFILLFQSANSNAQGSIIVITQIVQMTVLSIIPQYNQMMIRLGINPVATYAIFSIVASFAVNILKDKKNIETECKKQSMKKSMKKLQQTANSSVSTTIDGLQSAFSVDSGAQLVQLPVFVHNFGKEMNIEMTPLTPQTHFLKFQEDA